MTWRPDLTVAAVVERNGLFLVVEERIQRAVVFNQPAGHVEDRESILDAVVRETLEETAWHFVPKHLLGIYLWRNEINGRSTVRVAVCGDVSTQDSSRRLDHGILHVHWMSREQLAASGGRLRSPLVLRCIDDYLAGHRHGLDVLTYMQAAPVARSA
jgi:8-oxo-dGTP pyrophosphatase MutT (NUDIX family)